MNMQRITAQLRGSPQLYEALLHVTTYCCGFPAKPFGKKKKNKQLASEHCEAFRAREIPWEMVAINPHPQQKSSDGV